MSASAALPRPVLFGLALRVLVAVLGLTLLTAALWPLLRSDTTLPPVSRLEIAGDWRHLPIERVRAQLTPLLQGTLLGLDLEILRTAAENEPWVARARVERVWPDAVRVSVTERVPYARWGATAVIGDDGRVFNPPAHEIPEGLPRLSGPAGSEPRVREAYRVLAEALAATAFAINGLQLSARGEWTAATANGSELRLGRGDPAEQALALAANVVPALSARAAEIAHVDLRYPNGFAVGLRARAASGDPP